MNYGTTEAQQSFLTFPHNFVLIYTRLLLFGQIGWLLMYCALKIQQFYANAFPITTRNLGEICWALIGVGLIIAIRIKRLLNRENTLVLWADMNIMHKKSAREFVVLRPNSTMSHASLNLLGTNIASFVNVMKCQNIFFHRALQNHLVVISEVTKGLQKIIPNRL